MTGIFLFIGGLLLGSFINMIVWRIPNGITLKGRSLCVHCLHTLAWTDLIPVVSFLLLRFKCRYCLRKISWRYPVLELATAAALVFAWIARPDYFAAALDVSFVVLATGVLVALFVIDHEYQIVPDVITLPAIAVFMVLQITRGVLVSSLLFAALLAGGFFAAQYVFSKGRWIGDGDIRLGVLMGILLGWPHILAALIIAYVLGAGIGLVLIGLGTAKLSSKTPFGTYLAVSTFIALLYGSQLIDWYIRRI
ncbi:MAG: prepilin peptidase [Candidatus Magasanikbacteria bacterium]|nr:prepilin peptidase [Candidatus Magasanikbacteria bacterium]